MTGVVNNTVKPKRHKFMIGEEEQLPYGTFTVPDLKTLPFDVTNPDYFDPSLYPPKYQTAIQFNLRKKFLDKRFTHMMGQREKPTGGVVESTTALTYRKKRGKNEFYSYKTWIQGCQYLSEYKQVTIGTCLSTRDVIIVDIDRDYPGQDSILTTCENYNLPYPTFIVVHTNTNHYQLQWLLDEPFVCIFWGLIPGYDNSERDLYNTVIDTIAPIFGGDLNFTGCWCKNPFAERDIVRMEVGGTYNKDSLIQAIMAHKAPITPALEEVHEIRAKEVERLATTTIVGEVDDSRNCYAFDKTRKHLFNLKRQGKEISLELTIELLEEYEWEFIYSPLNKKGKCSIESPSEIMNTARGIYNYVKSHPCKVKYDKKSRHRSEETRSISALVNRLLCFKLRGSYTIKQIAEKLGIGKSTVTYNLREIKGKGLLLLQNLLSYWGRYKNYLHKSNRSDRDNNIKNNLLLIYNLFSSLGLLKLLNTENDTSYIIINTGGTFSDKQERGNLISNDLNRERLLS